MSRLHAPELEDEAWFPRPLRDALTAFLRVSADKMPVFAGAAPVLDDVVARHGASHIVDLCSGGGGPLLSLLEREPALARVDAVLTDLYPNEDAFADAELRLPTRVRGERASVDATNVPGTLGGVRTLFNSLHHFRPDAAVRILEDAAKKRQPLCVFEVVERHPLALGVIAFVPLAVLALTPWTRPSFLRVLLTYVLPLIPLLTGWDGFASCLRAYSPQELEALAARVRVDGYRFRVGRSRRGFFPPMRVTYLVGEPV